MARSIEDLKENVPQPVNQILDDIALLNEPASFADTLTVAGAVTAAGAITVAGAVNVDDSIVLQALAADPATPAANHGVLWLSDGTGTGSEGDLIFKWRNAADDTTTTETITKA